MTTKAINPRAFARVFSSGEQVLRRMNGHAASDELDLSPLGKCAEQLVVFGKSFDEFDSQPKDRKNFVRGAVKAALELDHLPEPSAAFNTMIGLQDECRRTEGPTGDYRPVVRRFLKYCSSRLIPVA